MLIKKHQNKFAKTLKHGSYFASFLIDIIYTADKANVVAAARGTELLQFPTA